MERYIKTYPKAFQKSECDGFIEYFNLQDMNKNLTHTELKDHRHFDEINLNDFRDETLETQMGIYERFKYVLQKYKEETGCPILLNTSFNDNGQPIVETPKHAVDTFNKIDLDYLCIGNYIINKNS